MYGTLNEAVSSSEYTASDDRMIDEFGTKKWQHGVGGN